MMRMFLALALLIVPGVAHADWYAASSTHFVVYSNDKPERVQALATNLERFDKALRFLCNTPDDPVGKANRVTVFVVDDVAAVARLAGSQSVAGFYSPRAGGSVAFVPRNSEYPDSWPQEIREMALTPMQILLHEYTHHFLLSLNPNVAYPGWFVEGYAEFFAPSEFEAGGSVIVGRPPQYRMYGVFNGAALPMEKLLVSDSMKLTGEQREAMYGRGWLLTHYLLLGGKRQGQMTAYFRALNAGTPPLEAARIFGDLKKLDSELWTYKRLDFPATRVPASVLPIGQVELRKLSAAESATMNARIRSKAGVTDEQAPGVYADARAAAAPYPNDAAAQLVLAEAAFDAKDYAAAEAAADRAFAADPASVEALVYKAEVHMRLAVKAEDKTPATWSAIRKIIGKANAIDTENPKPLRLFFETYAQSGQAPPKEAKDALYYAYVLAPQDVGLRFEAAQSYLRDGALPQARAMLMAVAINPHSGKTGDTAARMVAAIDAGHPEQAIAELSKKPDEAKKPEGKPSKDRPG